MWEVEYTDEFGEWWNTLTQIEQIKVDVYVRLLEKLGPGLHHPYSSGINGSRHSHIRELRIPIKGKPYRVLYAFDPLRTAILLIGGNKSGSKTWYNKHIAIAEKLYDDHLAALTLEGALNETQ